MTIGIRRFSLSAKQTPMQKTMKLILLRMLIIILAPPLLQYYNNIENAKIKSILMNINYKIQSLIILSFTNESYLSS